jgi:hypothetical protein
MEEPMENPPRLRPNRNLKITQNDPYDFLRPGQRKSRSRELPNQTKKDHLISIPTISLPTPLSGRPITIASLLKRE